MNRFNSKLVEECKVRLLTQKEHLLNQYAAARGELSQSDGRGDTGDQSSRLTAERDIVAQQNRINQQLIEIESALSRIEKNSFGICEITEEPIEVERLMAIPWTRFCIEGAEILDSERRRY